MIGLAIRGVGLLALDRKCPFDGYDDFDIPILARNFVQVFPVAYERVLESP